ncbi:MAG: tetratricopeptide repeat protein [Thermodesulfobacteriota bacterium]|nr:tetratricopeptide repeat protein [Thermodesulfobacteriota bacterium]
MKDPGKMNFLIVDDMDNMRRSIRAMLKLINYGRNHYEAVNGREAWHFIEKGKYPIDFIISDYNMPVMSGTELLNKLRGSKKWRDIPFLMVTANANIEVVAEAAEHEVDGYLTKPFVTGSLEQKIKELLAVASNPSPFAIHIKTARDLLEAGDFGKAAVELTHAITANPRSSRPYRELGRIFLKSGDYSKALAAFQKAVSINRIDVTSFHHMGQIYCKLGKIDDAMENYTRAMEISPRNSDRAIKFARLLLDKNRKVEAEKILKLVIRNLTDDFDLKEDIAEICMKNGLYALAVRVYREILKQDPDRFYLNRLLGISLYCERNVSEAATILEKAAEKNEEDIELMLYLARAYLDMGIPLRADKWAAKVVRIDPKNEMAKDILDKVM